MDGHRNAPRAEDPLEQPRESPPAGADTQGRADPRGAWVQKLVVQFGRGQGRTAGKGARQGIG